MNNHVCIREVGLRDGLQIIGAIMPTEDKKAWIKGLQESGFEEVEVTSLVPAKYIPQFEDAGEIISYAQGLDGFIPSALTPNLKGAQRGFSLGLSKLTYIVSASESFNRANVKRSKQDSLDDLQRIVTERNQSGGNTKVIGGVSSAFGCSIEGRVPVTSVVELVEKMLALGVDEIALADTVGYADPIRVKQILKPVMALVKDMPLGLHFHDTWGTGLANVVAALEEGVRLFDASLGGIGGCPNSPGATGNIATEDLAYLLESMGFDTGIDLQKLIELRLILAEKLPGVPLYGHLAKVGLPTGFKQD